MRKYTKPQMLVEEFEMSHSVATCSIETYDNPVTATCVITQSETVYQVAGENGCNYSISSGVYFEGGYFRDAHAVVDAFSDGNVTSREYSTTKTQDKQYYLAADTYLVWYGQGNYHVGPIPAEDQQSIQNHS